MSFLTTHETLGYVGFTEYKALFLQRGVIAKFDDLIHCYDNLTLLARIATLGITNLLSQEKTCSIKLNFHLIKDQKDSCGVNLESDCY